MIFEPKFGPFYYEFYDAHTTFYDQKKVTLRNVIFLCSGPFHNWNCSAESPEIFSRIGGGGGNRTIKIYGKALHQYVHKAMAIDGTKTRGAYGAWCRDLLAELGSVTGTHSNDVPASTVYIYG